MDQHLLSFLTDNSIAYKLYEHKAVFTVAEADEIDRTIPALHTKNLFLKDRYKNYYLVCIQAHKRLPIKEFGRTHELKDLSFASPEELKKELNLTPGSVGLFGLLYANGVRLFLDQEIWDSPEIGRHPNVNTVTLIITHAGLEKFLETKGIVPVLFPLDRE